jgi:hypothetical protein
VGIAGVKLDSSYVSIMSRQSGVEFRSFDSVNKDLIPMSKSHKLGMGTETEDANISLSTSQQSSSARISFFESHYCTFEIPQEESVL